MALTPDAGVSSGRTHHKAQVRARNEKPDDTARGKPGGRGRGSRGKEKLERKKPREAARGESGAGTPAVRVEGHGRSAPGQAAPSPQPNKRVAKEEGKKPKKPEKPEDKGAFDTLEPEAPADKAAFDSL